MTAMDPGTLSSDHVNYLIFRYLQEAGHENTARALYTDWRRSDQYTDPESLPFAADVAQNQLVHIIQDGLFHDRLQASVTKDAPRFRLTESRSPRPRNVPFVAPRRALHPHGNTGHHTNGHVEPLDDPSSALSSRRMKKKGGKKNPALNVITNGDHDAMDIDPAEPDDAESRSSSVPPALHRDHDQDHDREASEDVDADNDIDPDIEDSTPVDLATHSTQTVVSPRFRTQTAYLTLDKPGRAAIMHATWCPAGLFSTTADSAQSHLLVTGDSVCRIYNFDSQGTLTCTPNDLESEQNDPSRPHTFVSAASWHPSGRHFTCATQSMPLSSSDTPGAFQLVDCALDGRLRYLDAPSSMSCDHVIVLMVRYSPSGKSKLVISTNGSRGMLQIWPEDDVDGIQRPSVTKTFDKVMMDAVWINERDIAVCGADELSVVTLAPDSGLIVQPVHPALHHSEAGLMWDKVRYDNVHRVLVCSCSMANSVRFYKAEPTWQPIHDAPTSLSDDSAAGILTAMAFETTRQISKDVPRRLAVAFQTGIVRIFKITSSYCKPTHTLSLGGEATALALAWSPLEGRLAVAGDELIKIWDLNQAAPTAPVWSWQVAPERWYQGSDNHLPGDDSDDETNPSLDWDVTGQRLALALGKKMAVISILDKDETRQTVHPFDMS